VKAQVVILAAITFGLAASVTRGQVAPGKDQKDITVVGLDAKEIHLSVADLDRLPQEKAAITNEDGTTKTYSGVKLRSILDKMGVATKRICVATPSSNWCS
jgi:hypothetical protein